MSDITPGILDGYAERAFSYGACCGLAVAISDATGWPLVKVTDADSVYASDNSTQFTDLDDDTRQQTVGIAGMGAGGIHWLVQRPDGKLIDIDGAHTVTEVIEQWDGEGDEGSDGKVAAGRSDREDATDEYIEAKGEPVPLAVCATFVDLVLARADRA